jgi:alanine dehydrogenase
MLVLSGEDITGHFQTADFVPVVADAYRAFSRGEAELSPKFHWEFSVGRSAAFASTVPAWEMMATKAGSIRPGNRTRGLPSGIFQVLLHRSDTGEPLAMLDGKAITTLRTGAAAAVGASALARPNSVSVALIGPGVVGKAALEAIASVFPLQRACIAGIDADEGPRFCVAEQTGFAFPLEAMDAEQAVREADIVITVTPSTEPVVRDPWVRKGTHISAMGSDWTGKQELETPLLLRSRFVTDSRAQCLDIGEANVPHQAGVFGLERIDAEIGEVLTGAAPGRRSEDEVTVFDSSGIAVQDLAAARLVYTKAMAVGFGTWIDL